jgi:hypothetical protein
LTTLSSSVSSAATSLNGSVGATPIFASSVIRGRIMETTCRERNGASCLCAQGPKSVP